MIRKTLDDELRVTLTDKEGERISALTDALLALLNREDRSVACYALASAAGAWATGTDSGDVAGGRAASEVLETLANIELVAPNPSKVPPTRGETLTDRVAAVLASDPDADTAAVIAHLGLSNGKANRNKISALLSRIRQRDAGS